MKIVCVSDTHGLHDRVRVPDGDVLVHAGDLTNHGEWEQLASFNRWLGDLPHRHKVVIAGNHDFCFEQDAERAASMITHGHYLFDTAVDIEGVKFYGSPWQPWFYDWAFNLQRGEEIRAKWDLIPNETDVLITHGPPLGYGDRTVRGDAVGCADLLDAVDRVRPGLHVFGHIHEAYGAFDRDETHFVNASVCTLQYAPTNPPVVFEWQV